MTDVLAFLYESFPAASFGGKHRRRRPACAPGFPVMDAGRDRRPGRTDHRVRGSSLVPAGLRGSLVLHPATRDRRLRARHGRHCHRTCRDRHVGTRQSRRAGGRRLARAAAAPGRPRSHRRDAPATATLRTSRSRPEPRPDPRAYHKTERTPAGRSGRHGAPAHARASPRGGGTRAASDDRFGHRHSQPPVQSRHDRCLGVRSW